MKQQDKSNYSTPEVKEIAFDEQTRADIAQAMKNDMRISRVIHPLSSIAEASSAPVKNAESKIHTSQLFHHFYMDFINFENIWLLKPCHLNRGRGIEIFSKAEELNSLLMQGYVNKQKQVERFQVRLLQNQMQGYNGASSSACKQKYNYQHQLTQFSQQHKAKYIIQKYMEKPLLLCNRKFDIRIWVLISQLAEKM